MYKIIPMTRLGQESYQESRSEVYKGINQLLYKRNKVFQVKEKFRCKTDKFPEGHLLFPGTVIVSREENFDNVKFDRANEVSHESLRELSLPKKIAFLNGENCAAFCADPFRDFFNAYGLQIDWLSDEDIRSGKLKNYSMLIVPGGPDAGESYYEGLGDKGYDAIREFVNDGGMYLGSCAGSYFPLKGEVNTPQSDVWLNMIEVTDEQGLDYWRTGTGFVRIEFDDVEHPLANNLAFGQPSTMDMIYWEGPAFKLLNNSTVTVIAHYKEFVASGAAMPSWSLENNKIAKEAMKWTNQLTKERFDEHLQGYPAIIESAYGNGHMVLVSPHAEFGTCGTEHSPVDNPNYVLLMNSIYYLSTKEEV